MKVPMTEDRLYIAARVLCELRGLNPEEEILARIQPRMHTDSLGDLEKVRVYRKAIDVAKEEVGIFVQVLVAVEHSYEVLPLTDDEKIATKE